MNKTFLFLVTFFFTFINATAQRVMLDEIHCTPPKDYNEEKIFDIVERSASFYGGDEVLMRWLMQNTSYPEECGKTGVEGRVIASFVVDTDGSITNVKIVRSPNERLSKEVVRLVKSMPRWQPAMQDNKFVRSRVNLPIMFLISPKFKAENRISKEEIDYSYYMNMDTEEPENYITTNNNIYDDFFTETRNLRQVSLTYPKQPIKPKNDIFEQDAELVYMQKSNLYYPKECAEQGIQGRVLINFSVGKDGKPRNIKVIESPHPELSKEATTFVKSSMLFMPKAKITIGPKPSAKYYKTDFCLPIVFKLDKN